MNEILEAVLNSLWQALAVAAAVWLLLRVTPRINAATRHAVWWAVLAVVVVLPIATAVSSRMRPLQAKPPAPPWSPLPAAELPLVAQAVSPVRPVPHAIDPGDLPEALVMTWSVICLLLLVRIGWSYRHLRRIKRRAHRASPELQFHFDAWLLACRIPRQVRLLVSDEIRSPIAAGFLHPAVLLPESLVDQFTEADLHHVLLHELAHMARRDDWTNLGARLAGALLAFHPVAAWVLRRIDRERELACDDWVVAQTGEARPYAASLARLFELCSVRRRTLLASGMAENAGHLSHRIEMLLRRGRQFTAGTSVLRVAGLVVALLAFAAAGARMPRWIVFLQAQPQARAFAADTNGSFLAAVVASGYGDLSVDEIVELKEHGISGAFLMGVSQAGWGKMAPRDLMDLHAQGVDPVYLKTIRETGLRDLKIPDVIRMKQHGVGPEYVRLLHGCGMGPYSANEAIDFAAAGVPPNLFCALKDTGFKQVLPREIIDAKNRGLNPQNLREAEKYSNKLTLQQVVKLKQAGVI